MKTKPSEIIENAAKLSSERVIDLIQNNIAHNYGLLTSDPIIKAEGPWLYTRDGRKIFDGVAAYSAA
ncbi:MAG: hypothetical protein V3V10_08370, partial [Planctomycetota bacterium]